MKKGDKVKLVKQSYTGNSCANLGGVYELDSIHQDNYEFRGWRGRLWLLKEGLYAYEHDLEVIKNSMSIKEAFALALKAEPEKSFRKTGITNGDDVLTPDGQAIFLTWLLNKKENKTDFNNDVVQPLLKEMEDKKD